MKVPTRKQVELLLAVREITESQGYPPSMVELAAFLNVGVSAVSTNAKNLRNLGYLAPNDRHQQRSSVLTDKAEKLLSVLE